MEEDVAYQYVRLPDTVNVYRGKLVAASSRLIILKSPLSPSRPLVVDGETVLGPGYGAVWFLFKGARHDVARCYRPDGTLSGYYVDITDPVSWIGSDPRTIEPIVDLFLDIWIGIDNTVSVLDTDELDDALARGAISAEHAASAWHEVNRLLPLIDAHAFPPTEVTMFSA